MTIKTIIGDLRAVAQLEAGTLQHWDELSRDQIADASLRGRGFYVADFPLYTVRKGKPVVALARHTKEHPHNLVLVHLFDEQNSSYDQLIQTGNFRPNPDEAQAVLDAADTLQMEMSGLRLSGDDPVYRFLRVRAEDGFVGIGEDRYQHPNEVEQALIQRVGYTREFLDVLRSEPHNIGETRVYLLNPDYVAAEAGEQFVGRVAWRSNFFIDLANSIANGRYVDFHEALRGVRKKSSSDLISAPESDSSSDSVRRVVAPQGCAPEKGQVPNTPSRMTLTSHYDTLLADPHAAVDALDDVRAAGLSRIIADYHATRRQ